MLKVYNININLYGVTMTPIQLRMARAAVGWGVRELAEKAGVTANTVTRIENGSDARLSTMDKLCKVALRQPASNSSRRTAAALVYVCESRKSLKTEYCGTQLNGAREINRVEQPIESQDWPA